MPLEPLIAPVLVGGKYRLERPIGRGGMGVVYLATHALTGRPVAVKVLHRAHGRAFASLLHEARAAAQIEHPNIVSVLDVGSDDAGPEGAFLVLELLRGESLAERLARGPLGPAAALLALAPVMDALAVAHGRGIVHLDVKPANVFLHVDGVGRVVPKLLDFGIAKFPTPRRAFGRSVELPHEDASGARGITYRYAAPEQRGVGGSVGPEADVYAMALVLLETVTGDVDPLRAPDLPAAWSPFLQRALDHDPAARPTMRALAETLVGSLPPSVDEAKLDVRVGDVLGQPSTLHTTAVATVDTRAPHPPDPPPSRTRRVAAILGAALAAGIVLVSVLSSQRRAPTPAPAQVSALPSVSAGPSPSSAVFAAALKSGACAPAPMTTKLGERRELGPTDDRWCVLSSVRGALDEPDRSVGVEARGGRWVAWASGGKSPLEIDARCLPVSCLIADDVRRYVSSPLTLNERVEGECSSAIGESYWGDAATAIERLDGRFADASDYLEVLQSSEGHTASRLRLRGCKGPRLGGGSHAFFAGKHAAGFPARFVGPLGVGDAAHAGDWAATGAPLDLAQTVDAVCYLTRVSGPLLDVHGSFGLSTVAGRWRLTAPKEAARARCYALDQRRPVGGDKP